MALSLSSKPVFSGGDMTLDPVSVMIGLVIGSIIIGGIVAFFFICDGRDNKRKPK
jgi:hypothetical protein